MINNNNTENINFQNKKSFRTWLEHFKEKKWQQENEIIFDTKWFFKKLLMSILLVVFWIIIILLKKTDFSYIFLDLVSWLSLPIYILILNFAIFVIWIISFIYWIITSFKTIIYDNKWNKRLINKIDQMF